MNYNFQAIFIIAKFTIWDILRSKVMTNSLILGIALGILTFVGKEFTFGAPLKISLDLGMAMVSISTKGIALFFGIGLISKEIETRTVYMVLSKPIKRYYFILGKTLGLSSILIINTAILSIFCLFFYGINGGVIDEFLLMTIVMTILEAMLLMVLVIFFSLVTNPILAFIYGLGIFFISYGLDPIANSLYVHNNSGLRNILEVIKFIMPNFKLLNFRDYLLYNQSVDYSFRLSCFIYAIGYISFLNIVNSIVFSRKNLD